MKNMKIAKLLKDADRNIQGTSDLIELSILNGNGDNAQELDELLRNSQDIKANLEKLIYN